MGKIEKPLSDWAANVAPSPTLAVDAKAKALKAAGEDVCGFGAGEPDFDTPDFIKEACAKALAEGKTKYCAAPGLPALREALAERFVSVNGIEGVAPTDVIVSPGGKFSCYLAILAVVSPGDEVLIPSPYWVSYPEMVKLAGGVPVVLETTDEDGFRLSLDKLREAITPKTRLLILNSPSNPTGAVYPREELEAITELCLERGIYLMSDEIYEQLLYDGVEHVSPASFSAEAREVVITVGGFSKAYSMTGWRLGTLVAAPPVAKAIAAIQSQTSSNATTFAQYGALEAIKQAEAADAAVASMMTVFDKRRLRLLDGLNAIEGIRCLRAQGAFYLFPNIQGLCQDSTDFATRLLESQKVAVVPGVGFGSEGYLRFSYAVADEVIEKGLARFTDFCKSI